MRAGRPIKPAEQNVLLTLRVRLNLPCDPSRGPRGVHSIWVVVHSAFSSAASGDLAVSKINHTANDMTASGRIMVAAG